MDAQRRAVKGLGSGGAWGVYYTEEGYKGEEEGGVWTQVPGPSESCLSVSCLCPRRAAGDLPMSPMRVVDLVPSVVLSFLFRFDHYESRGVYSW